ncbi:tRNA1(Val) (adenine(37)-N6)-methyltransferase [Pseudoalteromonas obscura]|uniref:tRNA1(Val) (adenine(37)-N6)-methyltransferase n=1 Tax=Pseudoalteromonas obscura TaxID=3048491 RepID=A0ABT7EN45_9GAMM|nr:methyltransferase [Pseudoalteromonas sp. P94(2023)]MDK2596462.1 methyltransferase [Pseudoalteromonas sp. P94(2023)]
MTSFAFKQFKIDQNHAAMKVSTDGIMFGAWVSLRGTKRVLDIGAGTGLLSLMVKQRVPSLAVSAIEIDDLAIKDARHNFEQSPWSDIKLYHQAVQGFENGKKFDLIISNPPYFQDSLKGNNTQRNTARHTDSLSFSELIEAFLRLSSETARLAIILPYDGAQVFIEQAQCQGLYLVRQCEVNTTPSKPVSRLMFELSKYAEPLKTESLCIYDMSNQYSELYTKLCRDFYLKM